MLVGSLAATGLMAGLYFVALVISTAAPGVGYFSLFLMSLMRVFHRLVTPRVAGRLEASRRVHPEAATD